MYVLCLSALVWQLFLIFFFFFFNATATTEIYTLSLHDALPILHHVGDSAAGRGRERARRPRHGRGDPRPRAGRDGNRRQARRSEPRGAPAHGPGPASRRPARARRRRVPRARHRPTPRAPPAARPRTRAA